MPGEPSARKRMRLQGEERRALILNLSTRIAQVQEEMSLIWLRELHAHAR